jgi:hypothetical protein
LGIIGLKYLSLLLLEHLWVEHIRLESPIVVCLLVGPVDGEVLHMETVELEERVILVVLHGDGVEEVDGACQVELLHPATWERTCCHGDEERTESFELCLEVNPSLLRILLELLQIDLRCILIITITIETILLEVYLI